MSHIVTHFGRFGEYVAVHDTKLSLYEGNDVKVDTKDSNLDK